MVRGRTKLGLIAANSLEPQAIEDVEIRAFPKCCIHPSLLLSVSALLLCIAYFSLLFDSSVSVALQKVDMPGDIAKFINLSEVFAHGIGAATILAALLLGASDHRKPLLFAVLLTGVSGLAANGAKSCFVRVRPHAQHELALTEANLSATPQLGVTSLVTRTAGSKSDGQVVGKAKDVAALSFWDSRQRSFPSGHAATAWALALGLCLAFPRVPFWLFGMLAVSASMQRIVSGAHFPSDVFAGAAIAFACGAALLWFPLSRRLFSQQATSPGVPACEPRPPALDVRSA